jgi:hypothetical protein
MKAQLISPSGAIVLTGGRDSRFLRRHLKAGIAFASFGSDDAAGANECEGAGRCNQRQK